MPLIRKNGGAFDGSAVVISFCIKLVEHERERSEPDEEIASVHDSLVSGVGEEVDNDHKQGEAKQISGATDQDFMEEVFDLEIGGVSLTNPAASDEPPVLAQSEENEDPALDSSEVMILSGAAFRDVGKTSDHYIDNQYHEEDRDEQLHILSFRMLDGPPIGKEHDDECGDGL